MELKIAGIVSFVLLLTVAGAEPKPNFVIFFVDDMGIDQIEVPNNQRAYGYTGNNHTIKTPHVSRLAAEGLVFQNWYSGYHICSPSRAAMMTGRLPIRSGCVPGVFFADAVGGLPANETTMAEALTPLGYRTMAIGKWHLGQRTEFLPTNRGFQSYLGIPFSQDMGLSWWENCASRKNHTAVCNPPPLSPPKGGGRPTPLPLFANLTIIAQPAGLYTIAQRYATAATTFIAHSAAAGDPFLLYLPFNHIHGPNSCSATSCGQSVRGPVGDATQDMDRALGQVMDAIRADPRVSNSTLVWFTSDNGAPQRPDGNLPLRGYKATIWEGGYREPGIVWWQGKVKAGSFSPNALVATYDIFPTVLSLAGAQLPSQVVLDGIDLSPLILSKTPEKEPGHDCVMIYNKPESQLGPAGAAELDSLSAVRCGDYKVYWFIDKVDKDQPLPKGVRHGKQSLDAPVIFNVAVDWSESEPLPPTSREWTEAKGAADAARVAHLKTLGWAPNQMALGCSLQYAICSDPQSQVKYPEYPNCTISPANWKTPFCLCGGVFKRCAECKPPHPHFTPASSTNCTYVSAAGYHHRTSHGALQTGVATREECCRRCYENDECVVSAWKDTKEPVHECYLHFSAAGRTSQLGVVGCVTSRPQK